MRPDDQDRAHDPEVLTAGGELFVPRRGSSGQTVQLSPEVTTDLVRQGLGLCGPCELLYVLWARIEHARGRLDRTPQLWTRLRRHDADDTFEAPATPIPDTERAFAVLTGQATTKVGSRTST